MNRLLEGLPTLIHMPKNEGPDFVFEEDTPFVATGPYKLVAYKNKVVDDHETEQLTTRITYFPFEKSIEKANQRKTFAPCGKCWAKWLLHGEILYRQQHGKHQLSQTDAVEKAKAALFPTEEDLALYSQQISPAAQKRTATGPPSTPPRGKSASSGSFSELEKLMQWRQAGLLNKEEFEKAKAKFFGEE